MHYVLYTSNAQYWNALTREYDPPTGRFVFFRAVSKTMGVEGIFAVSDAMQSLSFWLGADAEKV